MLAVSEADPYVTLQLPTATGTKFKTKTVTNCSHPVWNETFTFLIQSQVKVKARPPTKDRLSPTHRGGRVLGVEHTVLLGSGRETGEGVSLCLSLDVRENI